MPKEPKPSPREVYRRLNSLYFRGRLPDIPVRWTKTSFKGRDQRYLGVTWMEFPSGKPNSIHLNPKIRSMFTIWVQTLIHEMVHVEQCKLPAKQAHGRKFERRMKQLAARGAFRGLW